MGLKVEVSPSLHRFLSRKLPDIKAEFFNYALGYMLPLEGLRADGTERPVSPYSGGPGHSSLASFGMVRKNIPAFEAYFSDSVGEAVDSISRGADPVAAMTGAVVDTANYILTTVVADTPVDTGRAWQTWMIKFPSGELSQNSAPEASGASRWENREFANARARERRALAKGAGVKPKKRRRKNV